MSLTLLLIYPVLLIYSVKHEFHVKRYDCMQNIYVELCNLIFSFNGMLCNPVSSSVMNRKNV